MGRVIRAPWFGYAAAVVAVWLISVVIWVVLGRTLLANISMLYLAAVLATAVWFGRGPAVLAAITAFVTFNLLFTRPYYTFTVADPEEWVALLFFLVTALVTGQLAAGQRERAREAQQREREAVVLYDIVRLMAGSDLRGALSDVAERLRRELQLAAVAVEVTSQPGGTLARAESGDSGALGLVPAAATAPRQLLTEGDAPTGSRRAGTGRWIRIVPPTVPTAQRRVKSDRLYSVPVKTQDRRVGSIFLVRATAAPRFSASDDRLLSAAAVQLGLALDRAALRREAMDTEILRRTDELKTALLNAVSHDLRTPLASVITAGGSLLQRDVAWTPDERRELAETIVSEAQRLSRIIGNLLDLSRMEAGSLRPERGWFELRSLVDDVLSRLRELTAAHLVAVDVPGSLPPVFVDSVEMDQVLSNLVENAVKYTPPGTEIRVGARVVGEAVEVEVLDTGPGIPAHALPHLFEPFYRVEQKGPRPKGTGLGLAVAKGLVEAHGGRIWAENRTRGGARLAFTIPLIERPGAIDVPEAQRP